MSRRSQERWEDVRRMLAVICILVACILLLGECSKTVYAHMIECTPELRTPNPNNDWLCWPEYAFEADLVFYSIEWSPDAADPWQVIGTVELDSNHWSPTYPQTWATGYYAVIAVDAGGLSGGRSSLVYWAPCAQWNVDIEMSGTCTTQTCNLCIAWEVIDDRPYCTEVMPETNCTIVTCAPPIAADWPSEGCADPGLDVPFPQMEVTPNPMDDTEWRRRP
jgi:hypothetical protein